MNKTQKKKNVIISSIIICILILACAVVWLRKSPTGSEALGQNAFTDISLTQTVEGITISVDKAFGSEDNVYILATASISEDISFAGRISDIIPTISTGGSYNFVCIEENESERKQTYLINIRSHSDQRINNKDMTLRFSNYNSTEGLMDRLVTGDWTFSFKLDYEGSYINVPVENADSPVSYVNLYPGSIVMGANTNIDTSEVFSDIVVTDVDGETINIEVNSSRVIGSYSSEVYIIIDEEVDITKIDTITISNYNIKVN